MDSVSIFKDEKPSLESNWRAIILSRRNVASYKFALAHSLLEIADTGKTEVTLEELAQPYALCICKHLKKSPKQTTSRTSKFLKGCKDYNDEKISYDQLIEITKKQGFNYVLDAFYVVNGADVPTPFFEKEFSETKKIVITDNFYRMTEHHDFKSLVKENESRWNLVETA